jgi:hypothetical protein
VDVVEEGDRDAAGEEGGLDLAGRYRKQITFD